MMSLILRNPLCLFAVCTLTFLLSCCGKNSPQKTSLSQTQNRELQTSLVSPQNNDVITCGDSVKVELKKLNHEISIDSIVVLSGKESHFTSTGNRSQLYWPSGKCRVGQNTLKIMVYFNDSLYESHNVNLVILSDITPVIYSYRVVKTYPHDKDAYTQGLIYQEGVLYESTGLEGHSSLRIVNINTGEPEKWVALERQYFGEGIAILKGLIYQITYKTQTGFVYDMKTLQQTRSFDYQIQEGWGLTTDGKNLIMSDGSAQLYFIEPEYFTQTDKIEVFDNKAIVRSLNELEYIKGKVFANVYGESYIVVIDPVTGKVTGKIDLHELMPPGAQGDYNKVLNGVAYDNLTGHLFVTGKLWPSLYEIALTPALSLR
jgi:glutaminyl-peptide cyclotransferase